MLTDFLSFFRPVGITAKPRFKPFFFNGFSAQPQKAQVCIILCVIVREVNLLDGDLIWVNEKEVGDKKVLDVGFR